MKTRFLSVLFKRTIFLLIAISSFSLHAAVWIGASTSDVIDQDLFIDGSGGDILLPPGPRLIQALTTNVTVTLAADPVIVGSDLVPGSQLLICAQNGNTVTVILGDAADQDLVFHGGATRRLVVTIDTDSSAGSEVIFRIAGDRILEFTSSGAGAGTDVYVLMNGPAGGIPTLTFERASTTDTRNVEIVVGNRSRLAGLNLTATTLPGANGAAALAGTREGIVLFEPGNTSTGRMVLRVQNGGAYVIEGTDLPGVITKNNVNDLTLLTLATGQPAGHLMTTRVINNVGPAANASLLVLSENSVLGAIQADPFCQSNFNFFNRRGVVLGGLGLLDITNNTFFDYVGLALNACPTVTTLPCLPGIDPTTVVKARNGSAFLIDGDTTSTGQHAQVNLAAPAAWFFRSGVANDGTITSTGSFPFTIDPASETPGAGNYVLDVEAPVQVTGSSQNTKIEILSLFVEPTGGPVFPGGAETTFPIRTFATDANGDLRQYNAAAFFINSDLTLFNTVLEHTDENHEIFQKNDVLSEPSYVGGEAFVLNGGDRSCINFVNSVFQIRTSVAVTGVDLCVPTFFNGTVCINNTSHFVFYTNGKRVDNGTGRSLILGTLIGSKACDGCTIISGDAHLDVLQTTSCDTNAANELQVLEFDTALNSPQVNNNITTDITGQTSIQTVYLGNASNISVGAQSNPFANQTNPTICINGNYFSFETRGGLTDTPEASNVTGQGGIFVDRNGLFKINPDFLASVATMVTKSLNGIIDLPKEQVLFRYAIGVADWQPNFSVTTTLIAAGECISDYTLNWIDSTKDYNVFCPYEVGNVNMCGCPVVTTSNVSGIPIIAGEVNQLQVQGSRIGDPVHLKVNGGWIRELVFIYEGYSAEAPTGVLVLENNGRVGLNTAHRNVDSTLAQVVLGTNGINVIANGEGQIDLNEDILVNNVCAFLRGPNFDNNVLRINADVEREFRVKPTGVLDFRSFEAGDVVEFGGQVKVILEAGATILMGDATVRFTDDAQLYVEPYFKSQNIFNAIVEGPINNTLDPIATVTNPALPHNQFAPLANFGAGLQNTDSFRVRLIGSAGNLEFDGDSRFVIPEFAYVGVETLLEVQGTTTCVIATTDLSILLRGASQFIVGGLNELPGGSFQVGNTVNRPGHTVEFQLSHLNRDIQARVNAQGFLGLGVGIVDKRSPIPNDWLVDTLFNVTGIILRVDDGLFIHDRTFTGSVANASLLAIAEYDTLNPGYTLIIESDQTVEQDRANTAGIHGGGNMVLIQQSGNPGALHPVVLNSDGNVPTPPAGVISPRLQTALFSSRPLMEDGPVVGVGAPTFFAFVKVKDHLIDVGRNAGRGTAALFEDNSVLFQNPLRVGWVDTLTLGRQDVFDVADALGGSQKDRRIQAADRGAVSIQVNGSAPGQVTFTQQLP
jgi:hypothetical protein